VNGSCTPPTPDNDQIIASGHEGHSLDLSISTGGKVNTPYVAAQYLELLRKVNPVVEKSTLKASSGQQKSDVVSLQNTSVVQNSTAPKSDKKEPVPNVKKTSDVGSSVQSKQKVISSAIVPSSKNSKIVPSPKNDISVNFFSPADVSGTKVGNDTSVINRDTKRVPDKVNPGSAQEMSVSMYSGVNRRDQSGVKGKSPLPSDKSFTPPTILLPNNTNNNNNNKSNIPISPSFFAFSNVFEGNMSTSMQASLPHTSTLKGGDSVNPLPPTVISEQK
jgi:hypothetical protein